MSYEIISLKPHTSIVLIDGKKKIISDTMIQREVGNATYRLLYFGCRGLYARFNSCTESAWKDTIRRGTGCNINDLPTWFLSDYYSKRNLKEDIIRIMIGKPPLNEDAKRLFGSSIYIENENNNGFDWIIVIFIVIITSMAVVWFMLIIYYNTNLRLDICKKNVEICSAMNQYYSDFYEAG
jgi:hypothetical protein